MPKRNADVAVTDVTRAYRAYVKALQDHDLDAIEVTRLAYTHACVDAMPENERTSPRKRPTARHEEPVPATNKRRRASTASSDLEPSVLFV